MDELIKKIVPAAIDAVQWADWEKWAEKSLEEFAAEIIKLADAERAHCQGCDELAAQVEVMREALDSARRSLWDYSANAAALRAEKALALLNTCADILRQRDARVLREVAKRFITIEDSIAGVSIKAVLINRLEHIADELDTIYAKLDADKDAQGERNVNTF